MNAELAVSGEHEHLIADAQARARAKYGDNAEVRFRGKGADAQWWVKNGSKEVLAADSLVHLIEALTTKTPSDTVSDEAYVLKTADAAKRLGMDRTHVTALVREGKLKAKHVKAQSPTGQQLRFSPGDLDDYAAEHPVLAGGRRKPAPRGQLLNTSQVAVLLGVHPGSVSKLITTRGLPGTQVRGKGKDGLQWRFKLSDVLRWKRQNRIRGHASPAKRTPPKHQPKAKPTGRVRSNGKVTLGVDIPAALKARLAEFVNQYNQPPFALSVESVVESALTRELDRLDLVTKSRG